MKKRKRKPTRRARPRVADLLRDEIAVLLTRVQDVEYTLRCEIQAFRAERNQWTNEAIDKSVKGCVAAERQHLAAARALVFDSARAAAVEEVHRELTGLVNSKVSQAMRTEFSRLSGAFAAGLDYLHQ